MKNHLNLTSRSFIRWGVTKSFTSTLIFSGGFFEGSLEVDFTPIFDNDGSLISVQGDLGKKFTEEEMFILIICPIIVALLI